MVDLLLANMLLDCVGALLLLLLIFGGRFFVTSHLRSDQRLLQYLMMVTLSLCITDTFANMVNHNVQPFFRLFGYLLNGYYFLALSVIILLWCGYTEICLHGTLSRLKGWRGMVLSIPALLIAGGAVCSLLVDVQFTIGEDCVYRRLPGGTAAFWLMMAYVVYNLLHFLVHQYRDKRYTFAPVYVFMLPLTLGCIAQLVDERLSAMGVCIAMGFTAMQMLLQHDLAFIDPLTGVFNRLYLTSHLHQTIREVERQGDPRRLAGILIDVDRFKQLNDTYGHLAGDDALRTLGALLREALPPQAVATRFGGDEFVVVTILYEGDSVDTVVQAIRDRLDAHNRTSSKPYDLQVSIGTAHFAKKADTIDTFFRRMDKAMYRDKDQQRLRQGA